MAAPFVVFSLPRSRTYWLSRFLSYGGRNCGHDQARYFRSPADIKAWLAQDDTGTVETGAAPWWRLLRRYRPDARVATVRRNVESVLASVMALPGCSFDENELKAQLRRLDAKLDQIEARIPGCLSVRYEDLAREDRCAALSEHCLRLPHDPAWWRSLERQNLQISMAGMVRYAAAHREALGRMAQAASREILRDLARRPVTPPDGVTIAQEPFATFLRDGARLFAEHSVEVGESPDSYLEKNIPMHERLEGLGNLVITTARCNGRMFGYLMTVLAPSLESRTRRMAIHTGFYASPEFPGLGLKLQRAAADHLRKAGIDELFMRAGVRGDGPRSSALFRRLGAAQDGELYRLQLNG